MNRLTKALIGVATILSLAACESGKAQDATDKEQDTAAAQLNQFLVNQPIPNFNHSQLRQNLIDIETAQATATATTSFFFNQGVVDPVHTCPSVGFAIPSTAQLSNPDQMLTPGRSERGTAVIDQLEATGVYTGDSTGTYVICVDADGDGYAFYWEGFVSTVAGPATWNNTTKLVELTGAPSAEFSTE